MEAEVKVSVYCLAYNHGKYIKDTLEGFVKQKTDFKFEVIIHDDASTDDTTDIIRDYVSQYPEIFVPIYQTENQYSKKVCIVDEFIYPKMKGEYVAICEGDDHWTDCYKLQKQVDIMEEHKECVICTHVVEFITEDGKHIEGQYPRLNIGMTEGVLEQDKFMKSVLMEGYVFHTSSFFYRKEIWDAYMKEKPEFYTLFPAGDFALLSYSASLGGCYFINSVMSYYRVGAIGGWTARIKADKSNIINRYARGIQALESLDKYTSYKYHDNITYAIKRNTIIINQANRTYRYLLPCLSCIHGEKDKVKYLVLGIIDSILPNCFVKK